jgi:microcystin-dependent protein
VAVSNGGTGVATLTANNVLLGNGTSALQAVAPGTSGNVLTSNGTTWQSTSLPVSVPTGTISMWPTSTAPTGWLLANGASVLRDTYPDLFNVIGVTFGSVSGTTFTLPNFTNRMPIGAGDLYALTTTGGDANAIVVTHSHTFTGSALAAHSHAATSGNFVLNSAGGGDTAGGTGFLTGASTNSVTTAVSAGTPAGTNSTEGDSGTGKNLPPYLGIQFIIKT